MSNIWYVKVITVTNMQMIITKIGCRIGQSCKIRYDVLIRAGVGEPGRSRIIPNNKGEQRAAGYYYETGDNGELCDLNWSTISSRHAVVQTTSQPRCCACSVANCLSSNLQQIGPYSGECSGCCWDVSYRKNDPCYNWNLSCDKA